MAVIDRHRKARSVLVMLTAGGYKTERTPWSGRRAANGDCAQANPMPA